MAARTRAREAGGIIIGSRWAISLLQLRFARVGVLLSVSYCFLLLIGFRDAISGRARRMSWGGWTTNTSMMWIVVWRCCMGMRRERRRQGGLELGVGTRVPRRWVYRVYLRSKIKDTCERVGFVYWCVEDIKRGWGWFRPTIQKTSYLDTIKSSFTSWS